MYLSRNVYDEELRELRQTLLQMGGMVEKTLSRAIEALKALDAELARETIKGDDRINQSETSVEERVLNLILRQQPVAKDLRRIMAALKIASDLERMGDLAVDIAKVAIRLEGQKLVKPLVDIPKMAEKAQVMVSQSLNAYIDENVEAAIELAKLDDEVDGLYKKVVTDVERIMAEKPETISQLLQLAYVGHYIERIADHATNVAESVVYLVKGNRPDLNN
jgi:phosphate transport system protein